MKNYFFPILAAALLTGTVVLSSCSSDELPVGNGLQVVNEAANTYSFSASALMEGGGDEADTRVFEIGESTISSAFSTEEPVIVFIERRMDNYYSSGWNIDKERVLTPLYPDRNGPFCKLEGDLKFGYTWLLEGYINVNYHTPIPGDSVYWYYGMEHNIFGSEAYYSFLTDGSKADVSKKDFCLAEMVVKTVDAVTGKLTFGQKEDPTKEYLTFRNINSIFRQKLTFKDSHGAEVTPDITEIIITSPKNKIVQYYYPFYSAPFIYGPIEIKNPDLTDGNIYFSTIFNDDSKNDGIIFIAYDKDGNMYYAYKRAPEGGFENNKYYYGDVELKYYRNVELSQESYITPITNFPINGYSVGFSQEYINILVYPETQLGITDDENWYDFSIIGYGKNASFLLKGGGTVTLNNLNVTCERPFIVAESAGHNITLNLTGDNVIKIDAGNTSAFYSNNYQNTLKLKCEGDEATLKIWVRKPENLDYGFHNFGNILPSGMGSINYLDDMAAEGYTVERSVMADDGDGVYWIYTVRKIA